MRRPLVMLGRAYGGLANTASQWAQIESAYTAALVHLPETHRLRSNVLLGVGYTRFFQKRLKESEASLYEARRFALIHHQLPVVLYTLLYESRLQALRGDNERAARLWGAFGALARRMGYKTDPAVASVTETHQQALEHHLGSARYTLLYDEGQRTPLEQFMTPMGA
jgi:hypothetical protein